MSANSDRGVNPFFSSRRWKRPLLCALALCMCIFSLRAAADVNVLIVGTTMDSGATDSTTNYWGTSKAFDITKVKTSLQNILSGALTGTVNVALHDLKANGGGRYGNQLISEFYDKNSYYPPVDSDFWRNLRGENGTNWDYVILMDEPNTIEYFPGYYTLGVAEVGKEVAKGGAETVLLMLWPGSGSESSVNHYKEVVYRTGRSLGYKVVPAGLAWEAEGSAYGATHPTADGAYLTAAAIYSRIWGQSASQSTYVYNDALADRVYTVVTNNNNKVQYSGPFTHPSNVFGPMKNYWREWICDGMHSSTEAIVRELMQSVARAAGMEIGINGGDIGPGGISLERSFTVFPGYAMNAEFLIKGYAADPVEYVNYTKTYVSDRVRRDRDALPSYPTWRHLPNPILSAQVWKDVPDAPWIERQHGGRVLYLPAVAYLFTLFTDRCPMISPDLDSINVSSARHGYEVAWAMSHLQGRAPGFQVLPATPIRYVLEPLASEKMTVRFMLPPQSNVTVQVSTDKSWAMVSPQTLTFTPANYNTPQEVTITLSAEAASHRGEAFNVVYDTSSGDEVCDSLHDSWEYKVNTAPVAVSQSVTVPSGVGTKIMLSSTDPDVNSQVYLKANPVPKQFMSYTVTEAPQNGDVVIAGIYAEYTPYTNFIGKDSFKFKVNDGFTDNLVDGKVSITVAANGEYNMNLIVNPGAEYLPLTNNSWTGTWTPSVSSVRSGAQAFKAADVPVSEIYQDVTLSLYSSAIAAGLQSFTLQGYGMDQETDDARLLLEFRNASGQVLGTPYDSGRINSSTWRLVGTTLQAPVGAVKARVILRGTKLAGTNTCFFDDLSLIAIKPVNRAPVAVTIYLKMWRHRWMRAVPIPRFTKESSFS